jgi:group I intron endonuclease
MEKVAIYNKEDIMIIYLLSFPNGKYYVGRTKNTLEQRLIEHKAAAKKQKKHQLYYAINKYGWDSIEKSVIHTAIAEEELILRELFYIQKYNSVEEGYNMTYNTEIGGDNWKGRKHTEEYDLWRERIASKLRGSNNIMYGKTHTRESSAKMKQKAKGRYSLPWFIERYGEEQGQIKYDERNYKLKNRDYSKMKDPLTGAFIKKGNK